MTEETGQASPKKGRHPAFWPLLFTGLILCVFGFFLWQIWASHAEANAKAQAQQREIEDLARTKGELIGLLKLAPCDAKKRAAPGRSESVNPEAESLPRSAPVSAKSPNKVDAIERACVFLVATDGKSNLSTGSGFFVAPGYVLTNRHVVKNGNGKAFVTSKGMKHPQVAKVIAVSSGKNEDYALLAVQIPRDADIAVLPLARNVEKTEKVGAWGYPHIVGKGDPAYARLLRGEDFSAIPELSYSEGVVSAVLPNKPQIIVHTAPISPGNSGGPLVNEAGEVVGINTMIVLDDSSYRQASLALSSADLIRFLAANGINL